MKKGVLLQVIAVVILAILAVVDIFAFYFPIVAIVMIALILFKPKWLLHFFQKIYEDRPVRKKPVQ